MLAMPGLRAFSLAAKRGNEGVSCDASGVFVGGVPLLRPPSAERRYWTVRSAAEINEELTARYRLPIDIASKGGALALIAAALNRGDLAMTAIAAVQMQVPDPPPLAKHAERPDDIARRTQELSRSGLLNFFWNPAQHPRAGVPPNPGWFTLVGEKPAPLGVIPAIRSSIPRISLGSRRRLKGKKGNMHLAASLSFRSQGRGPVHRRPGRQLQSRSNRSEAAFCLWVNIRLIFRGISATKDRFIPGAG